MKYAVIGAGGTGGCIGGYLARQGNDVTLIARGAHLEAIRENGLTVRSARTGDFTVRNQKACTMEEYRDTPDVVFVCVKYYSLGETIDFLRRRAGKDTLVIPILNVFGTGEVLQTACPSCTVLDGCVYIFSMIQEPGIIRQPTSIFRVFFGFRQGQDRRLEAVAKKVEEDLRAAGIDAYFTEQILKEALQKFSFVSPMGAAGLYYDAHGGDFMVPGEKQDTFFALVREVERLGNALGVTFEEDLVEINREIMMGLTKDSTTSMQRDVQRGGESEIDGLVPRVVRLAREKNVELPVYEKISAWAAEKGIR